MVKLTGTFFWADKKSVLHCDKSIAKVFHCIQHDLDKSAVNDLLDWDVWDLLIRDDGFEPWETEEIGDDK